MKMNSKFDTFYESCLNRETTSEGNKEEPERGRGRLMNESLQNLF